MRSKEDIEKELSNVTKDMEIAIGESWGFIEDDEFVAHLTSRREALEWVLE